MASPAEPLLPNEPSTSSPIAGGAITRVLTLVERFTVKVQAARAELRHWFDQTTDAAFIRSEINGRQSRRVVLVAFFLTDVIGANLWASWCTSDGGDHFSRPGFGDLNACNTFGVNQYIVLVLSLPIEGAALFMAGWRTWSFWSDGFLLPVWLIRLSILDVALWNSDPATLVGDALWFSVLAVMCRVHSLALLILVATQVTSLYVVLAIHGYTGRMTFELVRYGHYNSVMLLGVAGAYITDELSRVRCFSHLMALQDNSSDLAETMIRWKVLTEDKDSEEEDSQLPTGPGPLLALATPALESLLHIARHGRSPPSFPDESSWSSVLESSAALEAALEAGNRVAAQEKAASAAKTGLLRDAVDCMHSASSDKRATSAQRAKQRVVWWDNPKDLVPTSRPRRNKGVPRESHTARAPPNLWQPSKSTGKSPWRSRHVHAAPELPLAAPHLPHSFSAPCADADHSRTFLPEPSWGSRSKVPLTLEQSVPSLDVLDVLE
mmetsp:Transcript_64958/g.120931  ORF Transcript_64958/g.120931 Transcript_64958/m.120931 type:complete len:494 (+) Transcript_64958:39-1520(+)